MPGNEWDHVRERSGEIVEAIIVEGVHTCRELLIIFFTDGVEPREEKVVQGRVIDPETPLLEDRKE